MAFRATGGSTKACENRKNGRLSSVTAAALVLLLIAFYVVTINNMVTMSSKVDAIKDGPYPISVAAGRVETLLVQSKTLAERPTYVRTEGAIDAMELAFSSIDADMREKVGFIADNHHNEPAARSLEEGCLQLADLQEEFISLCRDKSTTGTQIEDFVETRINPLIETLLATDVDLLDESTASVEELYRTATKVGFQTVALASILMAAVLVALTVFLTLLRRKEEQQRRLQDSLEAALDLAQSANAAKSQFLSSMSHDIRTPMNAIVGLTAIANAHLEEPARVRECLERIATSSKHLLCLINDVLDMGKIESGKIVLNEERFSFPDMVSGVVTIVQPQARAKNLALDIVIGAIACETVVGDSMRLSQALLNIVGNAVKYTPEGGSVRLSISEHPSPREGYRTYRFVVQDTGVGMTPEFLERIFDPFEREGGPSTLNVEGTGLGMAITKNVVDMVGGTIDVESEEGKGSTFTVAVPLRPVIEAEEEISLDELQGERVLVVDDDADVLASTLSMLSEAGLRGVAASSGLEAIDVAARALEGRDEFCAIIVDWVMPGMDGVETARRVRAEVGDRTPIILLTAYDWSDIEVQARAAGVTAFVSKPLFKSRLRHLLKTLCGTGEQPMSESRAERPRVSGRVLLVEDNELNREIATELIRQLGPEVDKARDGEEALEKLLDPHAARYDLVFMDVKMPRMGGIEATRALREASARTGCALPPIIAMTANAFNEDREEALAAGMDGFMTKPIDLKELERILVAHLS